MAFDFSSFGKPPSARTLSSWFSAITDLHGRSGIGPAYYQRATEAVCTAGGLDEGWIWQQSDASWQLVAHHAVQPCCPDEQIMGVVEQARKTGKVVSWRSPSKGHRARPCVVFASPIRSRTGEIWGVLCGARTCHRSNRRRTIRPLEALWLELLSGSVSANVARAEAEQDSLRSQLLLEQAFAPELVPELQRTPHALRAREQKVSVLFCDLRAFSVISQQLAPRDLYDLLGQILDALTDCVTLHGGVVVDYYGDGLEALWNAPWEQPNHVERACRAAWAMHQTIAGLQIPSGIHLPSPLQLGCGIHTGGALVGNAGSRKRLKYGPRGVTVNVASRLESATKRWQARILISHAVLTNLPSNAWAYRMGTTRFAGMAEPMDVYELCAMDVAEQTPAMRRWMQEYEAALEEYEREAWEAACVRLRALVQCPANGHVHALCLLRHIEELLAAKPGRRQGDAAQFDPTLCL